MRLETFGYLLIALGLLIALSSCAPKDDTDPPDGRSGMSLHTDHLTGCQYLAKPFGGITPRVDGKSRHVGCKETQ
jgi:hypothetical protein